MFCIPKGHSDGRDHAGLHGYRVSERPGRPQRSGTAAGAKMASRDTADLKDYVTKNSVADLTAEQLQRILSIVEATCAGQGPSADHRSRGESGKTSPTWTVHALFSSLLCQETKRTGGALPPRATAKETRRRLSETAKRAS